MKRLSILLLLASTQVHAMWTEDRNGNPISVKGHKVDVTNFKTNTEKRAERAQKYYVEITFPAKDVAPKVNTKPDLGVDYKGHKITGQSEKDINCLAYSIFREAGTLDKNAQLAVGQVHINRLRDGTWGNKMCQVVYSPNQFSWTNEKFVQWSAGQREKYVAEAQELMNGLRVKKLDSEDILHYHANYVNPKWARQGVLVAKAGPHLFYKNVPY